MPVRVSASEGSYWKKRATTWSACAFGFECEQLSLAEVGQSRDFHVIAAPSEIDGPALGPGTKVKAEITASMESHPMCAGKTPT